MTQSPGSPAGSVLAKLERVMLVDDNPVDNEFHGIILRKSGFRGEILALETGEEALEFFRAHGSTEVGLLLLDINLPGANGFDIARGLMELTGNQPRFVVVMLTSSPDPRDVTQARSIGIVRDYLTKPLSVKALQELIERHFIR